MFKPVNDPGPLPNPDRDDSLFGRAERAARQRETDNLTNFSIKLLNQNPASVTPFMPYLLVRSQVGDHGQRPVGVSSVFKSPDIWVVAGSPSGNTFPTSPADLLTEPFTPGTLVTVYALVWNLGNAPIAGVEVDFYSAPTSACNAQPTGTYFGTAWVDLGPPSSAACHALAKCPQDFMIPSGPFSLFAQVSALGDGISSPFRPDLDRHVARRDCDSACAESVDQSYDPSLGSNAIYPTYAMGLCSGPVVHVVQTFRAGKSGQLTAVDLYLSDGVGDLRVQILDTDPITGIPNGQAVLGSAIIPGSLVPAGAPAFVKAPLCMSVSSGHLYGISLGANAPAPYVCYVAQTWKGSQRNSTGVPFPGGTLFVDLQPDPNGGAMGFRTYVCGSGFAPKPEAAVTNPKHAHRRKKTRS